MKPYPSTSAGPRRTAHPPRSFCRGRLPSPPRSRRESVLAPLHCDVDFESETRWPGRCRKPSNARLARECSSPCHRCRFTGARATTCSQLLVGISYYAGGLLQRILGEGTLRHLHPGKLPQNRRHFAHRNSHPVMHGVGRRLHSQPHPMRRRPILIECHVRMLSAHPLSTRLTPAHLHRVTFDFWLGSLRHIGDRHLVGSFPPQFATATRALGDSHRHWLRRPIGRCGRRGAAESKPALAGLAPRPLSLRFPLGLAPSAPSPGRPQFLAQLLVLPAQPINLLLRLA